MSNDDAEELAGLYTAIEIVEGRITDLDESGRAATADGAATPTDAETAHEVRGARHGALVGVRDALYRRITDLGGQWPDTEAGRKQPPTSP